MRVAYLLPVLCTTALLYGASKSLEDTGVLVNSRGKEYRVKRNIPSICKQIPINNTMLWTGSYAHEKVPKPCKSTYVHTKGRLLPMHLDHDIETYGELEVLATLKEMKRNPNLLLIDSRNEEWFEYRTIPGAINMPFRYFKYREDYEFHFEYALTHLGVSKNKEGEYDFSRAKTLVLFCNGPWCSQSPSMIFALLEIGYPAEKLKWYRGGMQDWLGAGMTSTRD